MLKIYLDEVNSLLVRLIELTKDDIENIKVANHSAVMPSVTEKNKLIEEFNQAKKNLDEALLKLSKSSDKDLLDLLDDEDKQKLDTLKENLQNLHTKNKEYAKLVLIVKDFFDGLINKMFNQNNGTNNAYNNENTKLDSIFKMKA